MNDKTSFCHINMILVTLVPHLRPLFVIYVKKTCSKEKGLEILPLLTFYKCILEINYRKCAHTPRYHREISPMDRKDPS